MMKYYMLVGTDGKELMRDPIVSTSSGALRFVVRDDMIAVILNIDPDLCRQGHSNVRNINVMARHVILVHTTKDGWYTPEDTSEWYTIWQPKKEDTP